MGKSSHLDSMSFRRIVSQSLGKTRCRLPCTPGMGLGAMGLAMVVLAVSDWAQVAQAGQAVTAVKVLVLEAQA